MKTCFVLILLLCLAIINVHCFVHEYSFSKPEIKQKHFKERLIAKRSQLLIPEKTSKKETTDRSYGEIFYVPEFVHVDKNQKFGLDAARNFKTYKYYLKATEQDIWKDNKDPVENLKESIDSSEVDNNEPVEDFDDYSNEDNVVTVPEIEKANTAKEFTSRELSITGKRRRKRDMYNSKNKKGMTEKLKKKRQKRLATLPCKGMYRPKGIEDILIKFQEINSFYDNTIEFTDDRKKTNSVSKRSMNNIIEEENLGTTISGFKFTGRSSLPNHDLMFKNINTLVL